MTIEEILGKAWCGGIILERTEEEFIKQAKTALRAYFKAMLLDDEEHFNMDHRFVEHYKNGWNAYRAEMLRRIEEEGK
jgi:hypothetical protein